MKMVKVSVIIPTYNCPFIIEAIKSVLDQEYKNTEIIIIDDGSTDGTRNKLKAYSDKIIYQYQNNKGPAAARNLGLHISTGKYIAFLDADDKWLPDKLAKQIKLLESNPFYGFVYCDNYFIDVKGEIINNYIRKIKLVTGDIFFDFFCEFFLITSSIVMRRTCFEKILFFKEDLPVGEDFEYFFRLTKHFKAGVVKEKLFKRRVWSKSLSRQNYKLNASIDIITLKKLIESDQDFYLKNKKIVNRRLADLYFKFGYKHIENGKNLKAFVKFLQSFYYKSEFKLLKNILACFIPLPMRKHLRK